MNPEDLAKVAHAAAMFHSANDGPAADIPLTQAEKLPSPPHHMDWRESLAVNTDRLAAPHDEQDGKAFAQSMDKLAETPLGQKLLYQLSKQAAVQGKIEVELNRTEYTDSVLLDLAIKPDGQHYYNRIESIPLNMTARAHYLGTDRKVHQFTTDQIIAHEIFGHAAAMNGNEDVADAIMNLLNGPEGIRSPSVPHASVAAQDEYVKKHAKPVHTR